MIPKVIDAQTRVGLPIEEENRGRQQEKIGGAELNKVYVVVLKPFS